MRALLARIVRGPAPPNFVPYTPAPSLRCRLGVHLWAATWEFTRIEETQEGNQHSAHFAVNLNRECDYERCSRCGVMR